MMFPQTPPSCRPGGRLPLITLMMYGQSGRFVGAPPVPFSSRPKATPTLPGPTSQTPLLQAQSDVISDGLLVVAAVADVAAPRVARSIEGTRMAAARQRLDGMLCLLLVVGSFRSGEAPAVLTGVSLRIRSG